VDGECAGVADKLVPYLRDKTIRAFVARSLNVIRSAPAVRLREVYTSGDIETRRIVVSVIGGCDSVPDDSVNILFEALRSSDRLLRVEALGAIATLPSLDESGYSDLVRLLECSDLGVVARCCQCIWRLRRDPANIMTPLARVLRDGSDVERSIAVEVAREVGPGARELAPLIAQCRDVGVDYLSEQCREALVEICGE
jgi:hypothetical protein